MGCQNFFELDAWKKGRLLKLRVYELLEKFPGHEKFELTSQLRRAVRSVPTNISGGHGRRTVKDESYFGIIARGSLSETLNHVIDAYDCKYISQDDLLSFRQEWNSTVQVLNGYLEFLREKSAKTVAVQDTVAEDYAHYGAETIDLEAWTARSEEEFLAIIDLH